MSDELVLKFPAARLKANPNEAVPELLNAVLTELNERAPLLEPLREIRFVREDGVVFIRIADAGRKKPEIEFIAPAIADAENVGWTVVEVVDRAGFVSSCRVELE